MTKQIFKGKRTDDGSWLYWNEFGELTNAAGKQKTYKRKMKNGTVVCHYINQLQHFLDKDSVAMGSGIKDFNGYQIFDGDILRWENSDGDIRYVEVGYKDGCFVINPEHDDCELLSEATLLIVEIAGTVYENPELLKEE